jgi:hypothetical protein
MVCRSSNGLVRARRLITLCCALLFLTPGNVVPRPLSARALSVAAITETTPCAVTPPNTDPERPNAIRRFFSWIFRGITRPFRRRPKFYCSLPPWPSIRASNSSITLPCPATNIATSAANCPTGSEVTLQASVAADADDKLLFTWSVTAGRLRGEGTTVAWDLSGVPVGTYTATVEVNDGHQHTANSSISVTVLTCAQCDPPPPACPAVTVSCPSELEADKPITFEANVTGGDPETKTTITWSITAGKIISGQGTSKITVTASEAERRSLTATASLSGADPSCPATASCTIKIF